MTIRPTLPDTLSRTGVLAVIRADRLELCKPAVSALVDEGLTCIELTMTIPRLLDQVADFITHFGSAAQIGVGTVTNVADVAPLIDAGAKFIVTPVTSPEIIAEASARGVAVLAGALTASEANANWQSGAAAVKVFPASTVGPEYVRHLHGPFPRLPLIPSGGVTLESIPDWIRAGALAVSLGGPLLGDSLAGGSQVRLRDRAVRALDAVSAARSEL